MIHIYRYKLRIDPEQVKAGISPAVYPTLVISDIAPPVSVDITVDDSAKDDLDTTMAQLGWGFVETDPPIPPRGIVIKQIFEARVVVDSVTTNTIFEDLLVITKLATEDGFLTISATAATTASVTDGFMQLTLDGVPIADGGSGHDPGLQAHCISKVVPILAGPHDIVLQWRIDPGGKMTCNPVSLPDQEHATLIVIETTS